MVWRASRATEPQGLVKTKILVLVCDKEGPATREEIADEIIDWSREKLIEPIRQRQGIYRHLSELRKAGLLEEDNSQAPYRYSVIENTLESFRKIFFFALKNHTLDILLCSPYFQKILAGHAATILREDFRIPTPFIVKESGDFKQLVLCLAQSPTAAKLFILEPKKLPFLVSDIVVAKSDSFETQISDAELEEHIAALKHHANFDVRHLSPTDMKTQTRKAHAIMRDLLYSLIPCFYVDIFNEIEARPYDEFLRQNTDTSLTLLLRGRDNLTRYLGHNLTLN